MRLLFRNGGKNGRWVSYTVLQNPSSLKFSSILEENCGADIIEGAFNCELLLGNGVKMAVE